MREMKSLTLNDKTYDSFVDGVARPLAEASAIVCSASGTSILVADSSDHNLVGLHIYGKSTQAGTPTPAAPVDIVSVGDDGTIAVTVNSTEVELVVSNLRGIPVNDKTLATYTDANGQMWCADEIDLERGVHIRRVCRVTFTGSENILTSNMSPSVTGCYRYRWAAGNSYIPVNDNAKIYDGYCTHYGKVSADTAFNFGATNKTAVQVQGVSFYVTEPTLSEFVAYMVEQFERGTPIEVEYILATPIETQLTADEIEAYKALHTDKPSTTVTNDSGAYMTLEYVADAKAYIDSRFASAILPATVE